MEKLPTAEEFIKSFIGSERQNYSHSDVINMLEQYSYDKAKFYVKAALENAAKKAKTEFQSTWRQEIRGIQLGVDKQSILNSFDINEIK